MYQSPKGYPGYRSFSRPLAWRSVRIYSIFSIVTLLVLIAIQMYWVIGVSVTNETVILAAEIKSLRDRQEQRKIEIASEADDNKAPDDAESNKLEAKIKQNQQWLIAAHESLEVWNHQWRTIAQHLYIPISEKKQKQDIVGERIEVTSAGIRSTSTFYIHPPTTLRSPWSICVRAARDS